VALTASAVGCRGNEVAGPLLRRVGGRRAVRSASRFRGLRVARGRHRPGRAGERFAAFGLVAGLLRTMNAEAVTVERRHGRR
jgi:hypothetical protein